MRCMATNVTALPVCGDGISAHSQDRPLLQVVHGPWNRKSISTILSQQEQQHSSYGVNTGTECAGLGDSTTPSVELKPAPSYSLWDLVSVGVGGTVGSGIFVLAGYINHHYAGPSTFVSFGISGLAALCSGISFAEFSGRLPRIEGSTYTYAYVSMGEYAAVLAAACLTLEYGVSGAAVARSWGDKVIEWRRTQSAGDGDQLDESFFNPLAGLISFLSVVVLACGVQESKKVTNFFTILKLALVTLMIVGGFSLFVPSNLSPVMVPFNGTTYGVAGILRGATSSFFGYLGFDEVCCLASEAKNAQDTPKAVLYTLAIVTCIYILASIALSGMLSYEDVSDTSGFPNAFFQRGVPWLAHLTALGEVVTLPVVVLISLLAQPRLCAAMARDGLLPSIFCWLEKDGNLFWGNILCGLPMMFLATLVPFSWMDDAISVGILFAFNMTNTALVIMRCGKAATTNNATLAPPPSGEEVVAIDEVNGTVTSSYPESRRRSEWPLQVHLGCFHCMALMAGLSSHLTTRIGAENIDEPILEAPNWTIQSCAACLTILYAIFLHRRFPCTGFFGDASTLQRHNSSALSSEAFDNSIFRVPLCPCLPLIGVYLNWYLISQLEWSGMILLFVFLVLISVLYGICISGSPIGRPLDMKSSYIPVDADEVSPAPQPYADGPILLREFSLPKRTMS